jgi:hypothetical protein
MFPLEAVMRRSTRLVVLAVSKNRMNVRATLGIAARRM